MTLDQIRMFVTIASEGSLANAARVLHKTQPALSIAIRRLEQQLGVELLTRENYRMGLTQSGEKLLRHCKFLLRQEDNIHAIAAHMRAGNETKIELVYDDISHQHPMIEAVIATQKQFPLTEIHLSAENRLEALKRIIDGKADFAISPWLNHFQDFADFDSRPFSHFEIVTVAASSLIAPLGKLPDSVDQLQDIPVLVPQEMALQLNVEDVMGFVSRSQIRTNDIYAQKALIKNGAGWGYVFRSLVEKELASGEIVELPLTDITAQVLGEIRLVKLASHHLGPAGQALWDELSARAD